MGGFGGMISFRPGGSAGRPPGGLRHRGLLLAESLGGVESLIEVPAAMTHLSVAGTPARGPADLVRLSVGSSTPTT